MTSPLATAFVQDFYMITRPIIACETCGTSFESRAVTHIYCSKACRKQWVSSKTCVIEDCGKRQFSRDWCTMHWTRWRRYGDITANHDPKQEPTCTEDGCDESTYRSGRGLCKIHYLAWYRKTYPPAPGQYRERTRRHLLKQYGLTLEDYEAMVAEQGGLCAVCQADSPGRDKPSWNVDHDHNTGHVRGLLCHNCNMALGMLGDDINTIWALIEYLLAHQEKRQSRAI